MELYNHAAGLYQQGDEKSILHCGSYTQAMAAHPIPDHMSLRLYYKLVDTLIHKSSGFCKCAALFFPMAMMPIHGVCISLHKCAPCIAPCVQGLAMQNYSWTLCISRRSSPGHFLFLVCIQYNTQKQVAEKCYIGCTLLHKCAPCIGTMCIPRRGSPGPLQVDFMVWGMQTPGHNLTPLDSITWLQPPETQNNS